MPSPVWYNNLVTSFFDAHRGTVMLGLNRLGIQSKLILLLLTVSMGAIVAIAWIGYQSAKDALTQGAYNQLQGIRVSKTSGLKSLLTAMTDQVISISDSEACVSGLIEMKNAYNELKKSAIPDTAQTKAVVDFYTTKFIPDLDKAVPGTPLLEQYLPTDQVGIYLQYHYIAANPNPYLKKEQMLTAPGDKTAYGTAHQKVHKKFSRVTTLFNLEDIYLIDADTLDVVYSYQKTTDFATNLENGPYSSSNLGAVVRSLKKSRDRDETRMADFEPYRPNLGIPMGFLVSPIFDGPRMIGFLAIQFPADTFNQAITGQFNWKNEGLGETGECYMVGEDQTMRSRSRFMYENPKEFVAGLRSRGAPKTMIDRIERQGNVLNALEVKTTSVEKGLKGEEGIAIVTDYRGEEVLSAYGHLDLNSVRWAIIAEIDTTEAFAPIRYFGRKVIITGVGLALLTTLLALVSSHFLIKPLKLLEQGARRIGAGEANVKVHVDSRDEFGELASVFNDMAKSLSQQKAELEEKGRENLELLLNILPASAIAQRMEGDQKATKQFADVTVLFADFIGLDELDRLTGDSKALGEKRAMSLLSDLVASCDEAADRFGIEKVRTVGATYLGVCGLSISRPDHSSRVVQFARDLVRIIENFNREYKARLTLCIGINSGPVVGGVVGRQKFLYDLWGDTVTIATRLVSGQENAILVTKPVHDRLGDLHTFSPQTAIEIRGKGTVLFWKLEGV